MTTLPNGTRVRYGFTTGEVIASERRYGQDGYKVRDLTGPGDYGSTGSARWVPESAVTDTPTPTEETP